MRVNQTGNSPVQNTETSGAKRTGNAQKAEGAAKAKEARSAPAAAPLTDSAAPEISSKARDFAQAKAVATNASDVREEKIAELKRRIAAGSYNVDNHAVADKMVDEHLQMSGMS